MVTFLGQYICQQIQLSKGTEILLLLPLNHLSSTICHSTFSSNATTIFGNWEVQGEWGFPSQGLQIRIWQPHFKKPKQIRDLVAQGPVYQRSLLPCPNCREVTSLSAVPGFQFFSLQDNDWQLLALDIQTTDVDGFPANYDTLNHHFTIYLYCR